MIQLHRFGNPSGNVRRTSTQRHHGRENFSILVLSMAKIPSQLQEAAEKIHQDGKPKVVRVKDLLSWFHAQRRGLLVVREIRSALKKAKLVTVPDFEVAYIDQRIKLKPLQPADKKPVASKEIVVEEPGAETDSSAGAVSGGSVPDPAPRIGMLKAANTPPLSVTRDTEITDAIAKMLLNKPANWDRLGYDLSRAECTKRLREVGRIRNDVMHFHPDGISPDDMDLLRDTRKFLQML